MSKQEEIREGLKNELLTFELSEDESGNLSLNRDELAGRILSRFHSQGVAIKTGFCFYRGMNENPQWLYGVEPLIEGGE